jgi:hypothetical protein
MRTVATSHAARATPEIWTPTDDETLEPLMNERTSEVRRLGWVSTGERRPD